MPPNAGRSTSGQRNSVESDRLAGSTSARSLRTGSARNHTGSVRPARQNFVNSSHSSLGGDGNTAANPVSSASSGRLKVWCIASTGAASLGVSFMAASTRTVGLGSAPYAANTGAAIVNAPTEIAAAAIATPRSVARAAPRMARNTTAGTMGSA